MIDIEIIRKLTEKTGCYLFKNKDEKIIYVGKANNLRRRVSSYFQGDEESRRRNFTSQIEYLDVFVTGNQKEALILEQTLVKKHQPRYNVLLKNSNPYPYIHITSSKNPRYVLSYKVFRKDEIYFGPFPDGSRAKQILSLLERILPLAKCESSKENKPCVYYGIDQCSGYCFKDVDPSYYAEMRSDAIDFFNGKTEKIKAKIEKILEQNIANLSFEIAQKQKKILDSIDFFVSAQNVEFSDRQNRDFLGVFRKNGVLATNILIYRYGKLVTSKEKIFSVQDQFADQNEIIESYIFQFYENNISPRALYVPESISIGSELAETLKFSTKWAETEQMQKIMALAISNAEETWNKHSFGNFQKINKLDVLRKVGELLKIKTPYHIEALDISNIFLQDSVASFTSFVNGEQDKSKLYQLSPERSDFDYMRSACEVHYKDKESNEMPDLIIVDGAREQIKAVQKVLKKFKLDCNIIGLVKNSKHRTERIMNADYEEIEFESKEMKNLFTEIQDAVHDSAITFHRKLHNKNAIKGRRKK